MLHQTLEAFYLGVEESSSEAGPPIIDRPENAAPLSTPPKPPKEWLALILEDFDNLRVIVSDFLRAHGLEVISVITLSDALQVVKEHSVSVVLMDCTMTGTDSLQAATALQEQCPGLCILRLNASASSELTRNEPNCDCAKHLAHNDIIASLETAMRECLHFRESS